MKNYIITYEDALEICKRYNNNNFYEIKFIKDGYKLSSFSYFICNWNDFTNPIEEKPEINAFDMRGVTFVFNKDGSLWKRFLMLPKFFNINQVESTQYSNIKDKIIRNISIKEDGSLIAFMMLPNGELFSKTIGSFTSEQSDLAYKYLYRSQEKVEFVKMALNSGYTPLFEYVSRLNRIVINYLNEDLKFLGLRDNFTGEWIPSNDLINIPFNIPKTEDKNISIDNLIERAKIERDKEGWVVMFEDGQLVKIKTSYYLEAHRLRTKNIFREDFIIKSYLNRTLDDIIAQLDRKEDYDAFQFIDNIIKSIKRYIDNIDSYIYKLKERFEREFNSDWDSFAKSCNGEPYFNLIRYFIKDINEYHIKRNEMILRNTNKLSRAREIVNKWSNK